MIKKGLLIGLIILILGVTWNMASETVFPSLAREFQNPAMYRPWSDPLMMIFFGYPFILGLVSVYFWKLIEKSLSGTRFNKALHFAKSYFIIATIPGMFISYTTFQVSLLMILSWTCIGFLEVLVAGWVLAGKSK